MARYADFKYGTRLYGDVVRANSQSFVLAQAVDYDKVLLTIEASLRIGEEYLITRTRSGAAEDPSKGVLVQAGVVTSPILQVIDGVVNFEDDLERNDVPVPSGFVYYTFFVFDSNSNWFKDAATSVLVPRNRGGLESFASALPNALLSEDGNPFSPLDEDNTLYRFLGGFAVTLDELGTYLDSSLPQQIRGGQVIRRLHDAYAASLAMPVEYAIGVGASSRLHRDAGLIYRQKGTTSGLVKYVEALTNWDTKVVPSSNLMLSLDDSSFEQDTGAWGATGATLERLSVNGGTVTAPEMDSEDPVAPFKKAGVGQVVLTEEEAVLSLPSNMSRLKCIPVTEGETYYFRAPLRAAEGTPTTVLSLIWMDQRGQQISTTTGNAVITSSSWETAEVSGEAPSDAYFLGLRIDVSGSVEDEVHLDMLSVAASDTYFKDARSVDVICGPARINLLADPSFEIGGYWTAVSGTITEDENAFVGLQAGLAEGDPFDISSEPIPALPGYYLQFAGYAKGTGEAAVEVRWYDADDELLSTDSVDIDLDEEEWKRGELLLLGPDTADHLTVHLTGSGSVLFDALILERADRPSVYFDSSVGEQYGEDTRVAPVGGNVYSLLYPNRLVKLARLRQTASFYLPLGVSARVLLWDSTDPQVQGLLPYGV
jgi:hypothetical protein